MERPEIKDRFWSSAVVSDENDCWSWLGNHNTDGYGRLCIGKSKYIFAHRLSWEIHYGEIPTGFQICHHCDNPGCINPKHLFLGTNDDNIKDKMNKGRQTKGEAVWASKLSSSDVIKMRRMRSEEHMPYQHIANIFGISLGQTWAIINKYWWKHI